MLLVKLKKTCLDLCQPLRFQKQNPQLLYELVFCSSNECCRAGATCLHFSPGVLSPQTHFVTAVLTTIRVGAAAEAMDVHWPFLPLCQLCCSPCQGICRLPSLPPSFLPPPPLSALEPGQIYLFHEMLCPLLLVLFPVLSVAGSLTESA